MTTEQLLGATPCSECFLWVGMLEPHSSQGGRQTPRKDTVAGLPVSGETELRFCLAACAHTCVYAAHPLGHIYVHTQSWCGVHPHPYTAAHVCAMPLNLCARARTCIFRCVCSCDGLGGRGACTGSSVRGGIWRWVGPAHPGAWCPGRFQLTPAPLWLYTWVSGQPWLSTGLHAIPELLV